jgi:hypothetical protein
VKGATSRFRNRPGTTRLGRGRSRAGALPCSCRLALGFAARTPSGAPDVADGDCSDPTPPGGRGVRGAWVRRRGGTRGSVRRGRRRARWARRVGRDRGMPSWSARVSVRADRGSGAAWPGCSGPGTRSGPAGGGGDSGPGSSPGTPSERRAPTAPRGRSPSAPRRGSSPPPPMLAAADTASNAAVNSPSRSRMTDRNRPACSSRSMSRLRAAWVTQHRWGGRNTRTTRASNRVDRGSALVWVARGRPVVGAMLFDYDPDVVAFSRRAALRPAPARGTAWAPTSGRWAATWVPGWGSASAPRRAASWRSQSGSARRTSSPSAWAWSWPGRRLGRLAAAEDPLKRRARVVGALDDPGSRPVADGLEPGQRADGDTESGERGSREREPPPAQPCPHRQLGVRPDRSGRRAGCGGSRSLCSCGRHVGDRRRLRADAGDRGGRRSTSIP